MSEKALLAFLESQGLQAVDPLELTKCGALGQAVMMRNAMAETKEMITAMRRGEGDGHVSDIEKVYANLLFIERKAAQIRASLETYRSPEQEALPVKDNSHYVRATK
jgi:hypothetical protein